MEFPFDVHRALASKTVVTVWDAALLSTRRSAEAARYMELCTIFDAMGEASKRAQGINAVLTSVSRLEANPEHRVYVHADGGVVNGILKVGHKRLFLASAGQNLTEYNPLCVLDFYVHEREQRRGYGRILFDTMLETERLRNASLAPGSLAYDRPSPKLIGFLAKHFALNVPLRQTNHFVVFPSFFSPRRGGAMTSASLPLRPTERRPPNPSTEPPPFAAAQYKRSLSSSENGVMWASEPSRRSSISSGGRGAADPNSRRPPAGDRERFAVGDDHGEHGGEYGAPPAHKGTVGFDTDPFRRPAAEERGRDEAVRGGGPRPRDASSHHRHTPLW